MFEDESELREYVNSEITDIIDISQEIEDFGFGSQTADLVFVDVSEKKWEKRRHDLRIKTSITGMNELKMFADLLNEGTVLKNEFLMDASRTTRSLNHLKKDGFVVENGGRVKKRPGLKRHVTTAAVQISSGANWQSTFKRAYKCHNFAEYRFVAAPETALPEISEQKEMFTNMEVGLISVHPDRGCKVRYFPDGVKPISLKDSWRINEYNAAYLNGEMEKAKEIEEA